MRTYRILSWRSTTLSRSSMAGACWGTKLNSPALRWAFLALRDSSVWESLVSAIEWVPTRLSWWPRQAIRGTWRCESVWEMIDSLFILHFLWTYSEFIRRNDHICAAVCDWCSDVWKNIQITHHVGWEDMPSVFWDGDEGAGAFARDGSWKERKLKWNRT